MKYLSAAPFAIPRPSKVMAGTCLQCTYGEGKHAEGCESYIASFDAIDRIFAEWEAAEPAWDMFDGASAMLDAHDAKPKVGTCATCKWWEAPRHADDTGFGLCECIDDKSAHLAAYVPDDWCGILKCKPDFGCTLWEKL